jgi:hypothetical protein
MAFYRQYLNIQDSAATPANTFFVDNTSVDSGNNTGWVFYNFEFEIGEASIVAAGNATALASKIKGVAAAIVADGDVSSDAIRLRAVYGDITSSGVVSANPDATFSAKADVSASGNVTASANFTASVKGSITANAEIVAPLYKLGEEWTKVPKESDTWRRIG